MAKKREEFFSPEFEKVLEAIDNWKKVNSEGKSFIASFEELDEEENIIRDTVLLGFGRKGKCVEHSERFRKELDKAKTKYGDDFINWFY
ncbi:hypothetical protein ES695_19625 [Candidatus Atribacteria bacterium 1244-E10-H5-B2]|nr:MAG: hypothetical protein ES695_19625 [Candidatus Atribacteria bacterium 1244-E10-H5-B2]